MILEIKLASLNKLIAILLKKLWLYNTKKKRQLPKRKENKNG